MSSSMSSEREYSLERSNDASRGIKELRGSAGERVRPSRGRNVGLRLRSDAVALRDGVLSVDVLDRVCFGTRDEG